MSLDIKHDGKSQKFFAYIAGKECSLKYEKVTDDVLDYKLMFVPRNLRSQGLADKIAEFAVDFAKKNGMKIKSSCSFVTNYLNVHHKETESILAK